MFVLPAQRHESCNTYPSWTEVVSSRAPTPAGLTALGAAGKYRPNRHVRLCRWTAFHRPIAAFAGTGPGRHRTEQVGVGHGRGRRLDIG